MAKIEFTTARGAKIQIEGESVSFPKLSVNGGALEAFDIVDDSLLGLVLRIVRTNRVAKTVQEIKIPVPASATASVNALRAPITNHVANPWTL